MVSRSQRPDTPARPVSARPGRAGSAPLNERIADTLKAGIERGDYAVGTLLPSEAVLCSTFGASRFTIRETLRKLADLGLIATRRGAGSQVTSRLPRIGYSQQFRDLREILQYARTTHFVISDIRPVQASAEQAGYVGAEPGSIWLRIEGLRRDASDGPPISWVNVFVHPRFAPMLDDVRTAEGPIYALIEARSGEAIGEAIQTISAMPLPADAARMLDRPSGSAAMKFVRRYCDREGATMLTSVNWHPGENFSYTMRIQRGEWR